jgi:regulator of extracellular matrix RemA (YlzA/DUF370 family)
MFLHVGGGKIVFHRDIIGIFKLNLRETAVNKQFLESALASRFMTESDFNRFKSFIVTDQDVFLSPIAPATLARRKSAARYKRLPTGG